jgi:hypothetical protein
MTRKRDAGSSYPAKARPALLAAPCGALAEAGPRNMEQHVMPRKRQGTSAAVRQAKTKPQVTTLSKDALAVARERELRHHMRTMAKSLTPPKPLPPPLASAEPTTPSDVDKAIALRRLFKANPALQELAEQGRLKRRLQEGLSVPQQKIIAVLRAEQRPMRGHEIAPLVNLTNDYCRSILAEMVRRKLIRKTRQGYAAM